MRVGGRVRVRVRVRVGVIARALQTVQRVLQLLGAGRAAHERPVPGQG